MVEATHTGNAQVLINRVAQCLAQLLK